MAWIHRLALAGLVAAAGISRADDSPWRSPPEALPPLPRLPGPAAGETPGWTAGKPDAGPTWAPATGARVATPVQEPAPPPRANSTPNPLTPPRSLPPKPSEPARVPVVPPSASGPGWGEGPRLAVGGDLLEPAPCPEPWHPGIPVRHRTFGSPSLTLSRDYHVLDLFGLDLFAEPDVVVGEGPAEDHSFLQAEYLVWWMRAGTIPTLATTGRGQSFGYLGQPGTDVLLGPGSFGETLRHGFRVRAGTFFDTCEPRWGIDGSFFFLGPRTTTAVLDSSAVPTIARPFFAPNFNQEFAELVAFPGLSTGTLRVEQESFLWGADVNLRSAICRTCSSRKEWFVGYRHLNLREDLSIAEFITAGPNAPDPAGTRIFVQDSFRTRNRFHGGQLGYAAGRSWGRVDVDVRASVALGVTHQELEIAGIQQRTRPGQTTQSFTGGLLAVGPNRGEFDRNRFSVVPEATVNVGYVVTPTLRAYVGYNFLYWTNVLRPGEQIDRVVDLSVVPNAPPVPPSGLARPQPLFRDSDLWVQGIQFGLEFRW